MAYTSASGTTTAMAQEYVGEGAPTGVRADALLRDAERVVADIAPPPSPVTDEYEQDASDAELRVFEILASGGRSVKSESVGDVSVSYADTSADAYTLVRDTMARWRTESSADDGPSMVSFATVDWY